jgi:uncharacterized repeat protein (TIGR04138 family)
MQKVNFSKVVEDIMEQDKRYERKAYEFVREGLDYTLRSLKRDSSNPSASHVSGQELLEGLRDYSLKEFGPMAMTVLSEWGICKCEDFGNIVFHLVNQGVLGKNDRDSIEDFKGTWSFEDVFVKPFLPKESIGAERDIKPKKASTRIKTSKKIENPSGAE